MTPTGASSGKTKTSTSSSPGSRLRQGRWSGVWRPSGPICYQKMTLNITMAGVTYFVIIQPGQVCWRESVSHIMSFPLQWSLEFNLQTYP